MFVLSKGRRMRNFVIAFLFGFAAVACAGQTVSPKYQVGHVIAVKAHQPSPGDDSRVVRYDVTLKIGATEYTVLYTPPEGTDVVKYKLGHDGLFFVGKETIRFNDILGRTREVPILRRRPLATDADSDQRKLQ